MKNAKRNIYFQDFHSEIITFFLSSNTTKRCSAFLTLYKIGPAWKWIVVILEHGLDQSRCHGLQG